MHFQFKAEVSAAFGDVPVACLCLIFAGRILKDHDTLSTHSIKDNMTVHLVIKADAPPAGTGPSSSPSTTRPNLQGSAAAGAAEQGGGSGGGEAAAGRQQQLPFGLGGLGGIPGMAGLGMGSANLMDLQQQVQDGLRSNPDLMRQLMDSPLTQSLMSNPEIMRSLIQSNPQMRQVRQIRTNPVWG